jgi:hypothetical protein
LVSIGISPLVVGVTVKPKAHQRHEALQARHAATRFVGRTLQRTRPDQQRQLRFVLTA